MEAEKFWEEDRQVIGKWLAREGQLIVGDKVFVKIPFGLTHRDYLRWKRMLEGVLPALLLGVSASLTARFALNYQEYPLWGKLIDGWMQGGSFGLVFGASGALVTRFILG
jgi:hypothetical protein